MSTVCEVCGDIGYKRLLVFCRDCKESAAHQYCLDRIVFDASLADWLCYECQQRHGEVSCSRSLELSSERPPCPAHFGSTVHQPITKSLESARDAGPWRKRKGKSCMTKYASLKKIYSSRMNSPRKKCTRKRSNMRPMGNCTNRTGCCARSIARTSAKALQSFETTVTEKAKSNNDENQQADKENSVHTLNKQPTPLIVNCLGYRLGNTDHSYILKAMEGLARKSKKVPQSLTPPFKGLVMKTKNVVLRSKALESSGPTTEHGTTVLVTSGDKSNCMTDNGANLSSNHTDHDNQTNQHTPVDRKNTKVDSVKDSGTVVGAHPNKYSAAALFANKKSEAHGDGNSNVRDGLTLESEKEEVRFQLDYRASNELQQRSMAANVTQPSTLQSNTVDKAMLYSSNMDMLPKENSCVPSVHIEIENRKENQSEPSKLLDRAYSRSSLETCLKAKVVLEDSDTKVEISDAVQNFGKDNPRKRRRLILPYDDDEEEVEDVQLGNVNSRSPNSDGLMMKHSIDTEFHVEEAVQTGDFNNQNPNNGKPVKKRRRYIDANEDEDEEPTVGTANAAFALNDVTNCAVNRTNLASQTVVAKGHPLRPRTSFNSESTDQPYYIYSRPFDEPVWSGVFNMNSEVFVKLDAYLSNKACQKVWDLSRSLQPVVEVMKLPRLQAWPKRWASSGPTDDCIGLFFFPHSLRPNEVSASLVEQITESDDALKVTVGIAELLIFPSTLLPEQNQLFEGKHYLWGVFKRKKDMSGKGVPVGEQDGSVCAAEEGELQEHHLLGQQDEGQCESPDQETSVVKHVENQPLVEHNGEAQMEGMNIATREEGTTLPGSSLSHAKPNSPKAISNCSVHPGMDHNLHSPEVKHLEEDFTSSSTWNAASVTEPSAEHSHGQSRCGLEPPTTKLFGLVAARTPRARQLIQEMVSEGALVFSVQEELVTTDPSTGISAGVGSGLNPDTDYQHLHERPESFDFISTGHGESDVASPACLELFPVWQEHIKWAPKVEVSREIDLNLSLGARSRPPSLQL